MARILSISYDPQLLQSRELILRKMGHTVISVEGFVQATEACTREAPFDLAILGHSIPHKDKGAILQHCQKHLSCRVLALLRPNEGALDGAAKSVKSHDPKTVVEAVNKMLSD